MTVLRDGSLFTSLLVARSAQVAVERVTRRSASRDRPPEGIGHWDGGPLLTNAVIAALKADSVIGYRTTGRRWQPPGLSYWAMCERAP